MSLTMRTLLGNPTVDNRPYELGLTLKYNKYILEKRAMMGRCVDENGLAKAFS